MYNGRWIPIHLMLLPNICSTSIYNNYTQSTGSDTASCWYPPARKCLCTWSALCCSLKSNKSKQHPHCCRFVIIYYHNTIYRQHCILRNTSTTTTNDNNSSWTSCTYSQHFYYCNSTLKFSFSLHCQIYFFFLCLKCSLFHNLFFYPLHCYKYKEMICPLVL